MKYPKVTIKAPEIELNEKDLYDKNIIKDMEIEIRKDCELKGRGFYLPNFYDWVIVKDSHDYLVLVPIRKR